MSTDTASQHAPDLSALTPTDRLNIAVAQTQGARWVECSLNDPEPCKVLRSDWGPMASDGDGLKRFPVRYWGPNYAGDPSAWGALMEKEGVWAEPVLEPITGIVKGWHGHHSSFAFGGSAPGMHPTIGRALSVATLVKHGVDPTPYIGD